LAIPGRGISFLPLFFFPEYMICPPPPEKGSRWRVLSTVQPIIERRMASLNANPVMSEAITPITIEGYLWVCHGLEQSVPAFIV
jgi:hypothetical protein